MSDDLIIRAVDIARDADKLAAMWKASDEQWPGTWSGGVEITPQMVSEQFDREKMLNVYAVETDDKIVGYCAFNEREDEKGIGYVALLNVQPDYQKKSLARRMLVRCVERCVELGFKQLTLDTWPGNLKSVPLYKKTGMYWVPDTSVHMRNFIPTILAMPCAQRYFQKHDWYGTFQRTLQQQEDDERWEGMKVFTYRWEADGDMLTAWVDRESRTVTAVETNGFLAAAIAGDIEPAKGLSTTMRWRLMNKRDRLVSVSLIANGNEHIQIEHRTSVRVARGETTELEAQVDIAMDAPEVQRDKPVPTVHSLLVIDGEVVELATGMRPQPAVSIETDPKHVTLYPDVPKTVHLRLRSHLSAESEAQLTLAPAPGLSTDWTTQTISIPAKSYAGRSVTLQAAEQGVYALQATAYFPEGETLPQRLPIFCLAPGGVLTDQDEKETRLENESARLIVTTRGGWISVRSVGDDTALAKMREFVGPPYWPSELEDKTFQAELKSIDGRCRAAFTVPLDDHPGLSLRREVVLAGGSLFEIKNALLNYGTETQTLQLELLAEHSQRDGAIVTLPLAEGIVQSQMSEFPAAGEDVSRKPEALAERWQATQSRHGTFGVIWEDTVVENEIAGWGTVLTSPKLVCPPQQWTAAGRLHAYLGPGDWKTVREFARRVCGVDAKEEPIPVELRQVYDVRLEPTPLVTINDRVTATLVIDNLRARPLVGRAQVEVPGGLTVDPCDMEIEGATVQDPFRQEVTLSLRPQATAHEATVSLATQLFDTSIALPLVRLGTGEPVRVAQDGELWTIDSGRARFKVAPSFSGSVTAWEEDGVNHLISPYPEQKTFGWMSPWYGGLMPLALQRHELPGKLGQERFAAQDLRVPDERGIPWRGVRVQSRLARDKFEGLVIELDYLTAGGSNVLKLVYRVRNETTAKRGLGYGWLSFWQPDGTAEHNTLLSCDVQRKPTPWFSWSEADNWGAVTNARTGRTAVLVSPYPHVRLTDWGDVGGHLGIFAEMSVPPSGIVERVCYIALCGSLEEAKRYICLKGYR